VVGYKARSTAPEIVFRHNGGPVTNLIYGYTVTDITGVLLFAERFCDGPVMMDREGRKLHLVPSFELQNESAGT
jgi:hypothetical protein